MGALGLCGSNHGDQPLFLKHKSNGNHKKQGNHTSAPNAFQALVNDALQDMLIVFAYLDFDDILIFSLSEEKYLVHIRRVSESLLQRQSFAKAEKCEFHKKTVSFLGFMVSPRQAKD